MVEGSAVTGLGEEGRMSGLGQVRDLVEEVEMTGRSLVVPCPARFAKEAEVGSLGRFVMGVEGSWAIPPVVGSLARISLHSD